jgi:ribosomal protein L35AE/L33A
MNGPASLLNDLPIKELISPFMALLGVVVGVFLTSHLSYKRSSQEKILNIRIISYNEICSSLENAAIMVSSANEFFAENSERAWGNNRFQELLSRIAETVGVARAVFSKNSLALSNSFSTRFKKFVADIEELDYEDLIPPQKYAELARLLSEAIPDLKQQARKEIGLRS